VIEGLRRGANRLAEQPPMGDPDPVTATLRVPNAVVCRASTLAFHEITTQPCSTKS